MHPLQTQLLLLTALRIIRMFMISVPVIAVYWEGFGLGVKDIMILQVIFSITWVLLEMPSGWVADRFGNKPTIVWGCILSVFGAGLLWHATSFTGFAIAEIIMAIGASLVSGARDALLYDTLAAHKEDHNYTHYQGRLSTWGLLSEAVAGVMSGLIVSQYGLEVVLGVYVCTLALSVPIALLLRPYRGEHQTTDQLWQTVHYCFYGNRRLLWLNLFTGTVSASTLTMFWYTQSYWLALEVPLEYFGWLFSGLLLVAAAGSHLAAAVERRVPFRVLFGVIAIAPILLFSLMASLSLTVLSFTVLWLFWLVRGISLPIVSAYVQREANTQNRATVLSANVLVGRLVFSITSPFLGAAADIWSFGTAFALSGVVFGVIALFGYLNWLITLREPTLQ